MYVYIYVYVYIRMYILNDFNFFELGGRFASCLLFKKNVKNRKKNLYCSITKPTKIDQKSRIITLRMSQCV